MGEQHEPMTDEELAKVCEMLQGYGRAAADKATVPNGTPEHLYRADDIASQAMPRLLAEVERLRAENAAWREIGQAVAGVDSGNMFTDEFGPFCCISLNEPGKPYQHAPTCPVTRARALLNKKTPESQI